MIHVVCSTCDQVYHADDAHGGKYIRCTKCGSLLAIPGSKTIPNHQQPDYHFLRDSKGYSIPKCRSGISRILIGLTALAAVVVFAYGSGRSTDNAAVSGRLVDPPVRSGVSPETEPSENWGSAADAELQHPRPSSGTEISPPEDSSGFGCITIDNGTQFDAIIKLVREGATRRCVYVRSKEKTTIEGIAPGTYHLLFSTGIDLNPESTLFERDKSYVKFEEPFVFEETSTEKGTMYDVFDVTLHGVVGGTADTIQLDESVFTRVDKLLPVI